MSFWYPQATEPVLRAISFRVEPGETVAVLGLTGSGKSTVAKLIPRSYDASEGQVLIGGQDVREFTLGSLRGSVAVVMQDVFLFSGSIRENIAFGNRDVTDEDVTAVAKMVQLHEFIGRLSNGYGEEVGDAVSCYPEDRSRELASPGPYSRIP